MEFANLDLPLARGCRARLINLKSRTDLNGKEVECPLHGGSFNAITGVPMNPPASETLRIFQVQIEGDDIFIAPPNS